MKLTLQLHTATQNVRYVFQKSVKKASIENLYMAFFCVFDLLSANSKNH